jgi:hypothetical protein
MALDFDAATINEFLELATMFGLRETSYTELKREVATIVVDSAIPDPEKAVESLGQYRLVGAEQLRPSDHVRWIRGAEASPTGRPSGPTLGGFVTSIVPREDGEHGIKCVNTIGRHFQATTRPGLWLFRRLTEQEIVVLTVLESLDQ